MLLPSLTPNIRAHKVDFKEDKNSRNYGFSDDKIELSK